MQTKLTLLKCIVLFVTVIRISFAQAPRSYSSSEILLQLKKLNTVGSVLYIAAHPDDENTRLIAYLANEKCLRTGYLSLTRGDGGQNLIGPEQGVELGVIRTQELLAARSIDGGEQFFTRAYDFGYSKSPEETLNKWNKDSILSDMVWVIRNFRPDIIITRFATDGSGGHGHHTASAMLAEEAFDAAGDPNRFPYQLQYVEVWKPRRLLYNATNRFRDPNADMSSFIKLDVGGYNPLLGKSYGEISAESRSMHKSQGFGSAKQRGAYFEYFKPVKGDTMGLKDIFQGIDFSWNRVKDGEKIGKEISQIIKGFDMESPDLSVNVLFKLRKTMCDPADNYLVSNRDPDKVGEFMFNRSKIFYFQLRKAALLDKIIAASAGIVLDATADAYHINQNGRLAVTLSLTNRRQTGTTLSRVNFSMSNDSNCAIALIPNKEYKFTKTITWNTDYAYSAPYWLQQPKSVEGRFNSPLLNIGKAQNDVYGKQASVTLLINGNSINIPATIQYRWVDPEKGEIYRPAIIVPPVLISLENNILVFGDNKPKEIKLTLKAQRDSVHGLIRIPLPKGWFVQAKGPDLKGKLKTPEESCLVFNLNKKGESSTEIFMVYPPENSSDVTLTVNVEVGGEHYSVGLKEIKYDHIPVQTLFTKAELKLIRLDLKHQLKKIGYIPGAGDEVQSCLSQIGYEVVTLTDEMLTKDNLSQYEAIVTGVRAYNTNEKLPSFKQKLMDYVANGGNLIVQYNTNSWAGPLSSDIGPHKFKITRNRITEEEAKVNFELPDHPILNSPNKISEADFKGWVQERSIYHAGEWDSNFVAPISMVDPWEPPAGANGVAAKADKGALIIARHGKGNFIYTGLVFFRELPAGVPGAYRLFVNLIEYGK